jgi:GTP-binding protein
MISASETRNFPAEDLPEVAFAGRSNVGKSSLINALVGVHRLAKTSQTPGRTRLLNWFRVEPPLGDALSFVDLPGYGYAKVSRSQRDAWRPLVESYLRGRGVLRGVVVLLDARRGAEAEEIDLLEWLASLEIPAIVVLTKTDKLPKARRKVVGMEVGRKLGGIRPVLASAVTGEGLDEVWRGIARLV